MYRIIELLSSSSGSAVITTRGFLPAGVSKYLYCVVARAVCVAACLASAAERICARLMATRLDAPINFVTIPLLGKPIYTLIPEAGESFYVRSRLRRATESFVLRGRPFSRLLRPAGRAARRARRCPRVHRAHVSPDGDRRPRPNGSL